MCCSFQHCWLHHWCSSQLQPGAAPGWCCRDRHLLHHCHCCWDLGKNRKCSAPLPACMTVRVRHQLLTFICFIVFKASQPQHRWRILPGWSLNDLVSCKFSSSNYQATHESRSAGTCWFTAAQNTSAQQLTGEISAHLYPEFGFPALITTGTHNINAPDDLWPELPRILGKAKVHIESLCGTDVPTADNK